MNLVITVLVLLLTLCIIFYFRKWTRQKKYNFPPGPKGLPIIGNLLEVSPTHAHVSYSEIGKEFGDIFTVNILGNKLVILNSMAAIREAFVNEEHAPVFAGRPYSFLGNYTDDGCSSFSFMSTCKIWMRLRKLVYKTINMYGDGIQEAENNILEELEHVVDWIETHKDKPMDLADVLVPSLSNIMTYLLIGKRFHYDSKELKAAVNMSFGINEMGTAGIDAVMTNLPFLRFFNIGYGAIYQRYMAGIQEYLKYYYHAQKETYDPSVTRGLIDVLLKTQQELNERGDNCPILDRNVTSTMKDTIEAGTLTTRASLMSFFLVIAHQPEVAERIQAEVDDVIGPNRYPSLKDRPSMPYTEASVLELVRFVTPIPLALPHCTLEETKFRDYLLPRNTIVLPNYWGIHHDETFWERPMEFHPERFLDEDGNLVPLEHKNRRSLLSFSTGKRSCPGENFAKSRMFLFISTLLQKFRITAAEGFPLPPNDSRHFTHGIVPCPAPFKVKVESRQ